jgi:hypothetical protein
MIRSSHARSRSLRVLAGSTVVAAGLAVAVPVSAQAATVACSSTALITAINTANGVLSPSTLVLTPLCTYNLTTVNNTTNGANGLPVIIRDITFSGDQNLITRSGAAGTPTFRIAQVSGGTGKLTLKNTTLNNGSATGAGGGILNYGSVTLTGSALTNNKASSTGGGLSNVDVPSPGIGAAATFTSSTVSGNTATGRGGGIYNGLRGSLTTTSTSIKSNSTTGAQGGGIAAINSTATTMTTTPITINSANALLVGGAGGVFRIGGIMTSTDSPVTFNTPNNCTGSSPPVPGCIG